MKEKMLARFVFPDKLKEKLVTMVVYQNRNPKEVARQYLRTGGQSELNSCYSLYTNTDRRLILHVSACRNPC